MKRRKGVVFALLILFEVLMVYARSVWQGNPSLTSCMIFWIVAIGFHVALFMWLYSNPKRRVASLGLLAVLLGAAMNAIVTVANSGYMPVIGESIPKHSVWVAATDSHDLLFLADRAAWLGFSIGDVFIFLGIIAVWALFVYSMAKKQGEPRIPKAPVSLRRVST